MFGFNDPNFWSNFWPNFWADLFVGVVITSLVAWLYTKSMRIGARVVAVKRPSEYPDKLRITFFLWNTGSRAFFANEVYYHLYIPARFKVVGFEQQDQDILGVQELSDPLDHAVSLLKIPAFPEKKTQLCSVLITAIIGQDIPMYYALDTIYGKIPGNLTLFFKMLRNGGVRFGEVGDLMAVPILGGKIYTRKIYFNNAVSVLDKIEILDR